MNNLSRTLTVALFSVLLAFPADLNAKDVEDRKWIEVSTPSFRIRSLLSERESVDLARYLEVFRLVAAIVTNTGLVETPVPTEIYAISSGSASKSFGVGNNTAGFFRTGLRRNIILIRNTVGMDERSIIMHEYVHFIVRNHSDANYPMWFHEGFAEYLSSAVIDDGVVTIGGMPKHRISTFKDSPFRPGPNWVHLRRVVARQGGEQWGPALNALFYAESWGLVHFLQNRDDNDTPFGQQLEEYIAQMDGGVDPVEAFEDAFEITMHKLDQGVRRYLGAKRIPGFRFELDAIVSNFEPAVRSIDREEIALALGQYGLPSGDLERAERWFTIAADDPRFAAQATAGLADVQKFQGNYDEALPLFEKAIELAPDDPYCQLDMAEYWHDLAEDPERESERNANLQKAREHYLLAWKLDARMPETYTMYGRTFLADGSDYAKAVEMLEQAQRLLPSSIEIRLSLSEAYSGAEKMEQAAKSARSVLAWIHDESEAADKAREILSSADPAYVDEPSEAAED